MTTNHAATTAATVNRCPPLPLPLGAMVSACCYLLPGQHRPCTSMLGSSLDGIPGPGLFVGHGTYCDTRTRSVGFYFWWHGIFDFASSSFLPLSWVLRLWVVLYPYMCVSTRTQAGRIGFVLPVRDKMTSRRGWESLVLDVSWSVHARRRAV